MAIFSNVNAAPSKWILPHMRPPPFAEPLHPPSPLLMLLQATDLAYRHFLRLIILEDLPHVLFHLYHSAESFRSTPNFTRCNL